MRRTVALPVLGRRAMSDRARFVLAVVGLVAGAVAFWACSGAYLSMTGWH
jgi:hypothetical protein